MHSYVMEAVGAFFLVLVFTFTGDALAIGLTLTALVYMGWQVSGAHYNPAVSLAFFLRKKLSFGELCTHVASQLIGGTAAAAVVYFLTSSVFYLEPPATTNLYQQGFAEVAFTFLFVMVMLTLSQQQSAHRNHVSGVAVGLTFAGVIMVTKPVSGGVLNPAIAIGTGLFDLIMGGYSIKHSLLYTLAPLTGGALAALAISYFHSPAEE